MRNSRAMANYDKANIYLSKFDFIYIDDLTIFSLDFLLESPFLCFLWLKGIKCIGNATKKTIIYDLYRNVPLRPYAVPVLSACKHTLEQFEYS